MAAKKNIKTDQVPEKSAKGAPEADTSGLGSVIVRNEFYRDGYRSLLRLALLQGLASLGLLGAMYFVIQVHQPENRYFATTEDGRLVPMVPLNEPNLSTPALMSWVAQAATEVMTFGFNDYRRRLQNHRETLRAAAGKALLALYSVHALLRWLRRISRSLPPRHKGRRLLFPKELSPGAINGRYRCRCCSLINQGHGRELINCLSRLLLCAFPDLKALTGLELSSGSLYRTSDFAFVLKIAILQILFFLKI